MPDTAAPAPDGATPAAAPDPAPQDAAPLDLRGLRCPLPALKTRKALSRTAPGGRLRVDCTDPLSVIDIPHLLATTGDVLEAQAQEDGVYRFLIRKAAPPPA